MGSTFSDFLSQIPSVIFVPFCASALLLVIVMALIVRARVQRSGHTAPAAAESVSVFKRKRSSAPDSAADLPDLDMLVDTATLTGAPETASESAVAAAPSRPARPGVQPLALGDGSSVQAVEVLRVLRDITGGGLVVQMGDRAYRTLGEDETFRTDFLRIMRELSPLVRGEAPSQPAAAPAPTPASSAEAEPIVAEKATPSLGDLLAVREPKPDFPPPSLPPVSDGEMPGDLPRFSLEDAPAPPKGGLFRRQKREAPPPVPDLDIAGAIETYVQHKRSFTPDLADRSVHIHPSPDGGVLIEVDGAFYETVDAVDDDDVRLFLTTAIAEWQSRLK
jgi:hypothetical protein